MSVEEFESILKELRLKTSSSISGSRISKLVALAVQNVASESKLISILYSNCKAAPSQNKIATMYVVDAIMRAYSDEAKKAGETIDSSAPEGTFASGVVKITELIESLFDDAMELQFEPSMKSKFSKLVDLWKKTQTFSPELIEKLNKKYFASTTPPGSPPKANIEPVKPKAENSSEPSSILSSLASIAKSSTPTSEVEPPKKDTTSILSQLSALSNVTNGAPTNQAAPVGGQGPDILNVLQQMQQNVSYQQQQQAPQQPQYQQPPQHQDHHNYQRESRQDSGYTRRNRSRSPNRGGFIRSPPQHQAAVNENNQFAPGNLGGEMNVPGSEHYRPRNVGFDSNVPQNTFKVLSRTLFIGGVPRNMDETSLAAVLRPFAEVQSIILNSERKHAFVKVYSRHEAEQVITSFNKDGKLPLRTRWGVGFGPRDCCNYQHGISMIPMTRLTDADKSWVVNAQWGGTGGQPLQAGMVIDEPDIEIGTGISSKAMSKKMPTNSARNGPKSNRPGEPDEDYVKTTLIGPPGGQANQPPSQFAQGSNPLAGLFANSNTQPPVVAGGYQGSPQGGYQAPVPAQGGYQNYQSPPQNYQQPQYQNFNSFPPQQQPPQGQGYNQGYSNYYQGQ
ncbi:uncharacterized protein RJT21DRAFT_117961 [Scheffersomyces amazonensis]|uniref:uncharacterized protein n=1 Tax=Scheffersomyces amazonensis TaxID=1078765 RepID=UPI00315C8BF4